MRNLALLCLLASALVLNACSSGNSDTPGDRNAHPDGWLVAHSADASDSPGYVDCAGCHGADLKGSGDAVSCFSCHSYNTAPPFTIHPEEWSDAYASHRAFAALNGYDSCMPCHGAGLRGSEAAPSCFAAEFDGRGCHAEGPGEVPHPLDGSYLAGSAHGPDAKQDLTACQTCHAEPGGPGDNPRFNIGIEAEGGEGCEGCHGLNYAHPENWAGPNETFHYTAGSIQQACTLCHGADLLGEASGGVGVSCLGCHVSVETFTLDCTYCHGYPPDGSANVATTTGVDHTAVAQVAFPFHSNCLYCHGMQETATGDEFDPVSNYLLFDYSTETNGYHWDGKIQMNSEPGYNPETFGCTSCHGDNESHRMSGSGLPVMLRDFTSGD